MIAPIEGDDGWLLGAGRGFVHLAPDGTHRTIAEVSPPATRMNDGACDPQGRFWAGTLADDHHGGGGALYRLDGTGRTELMLDGLTISNGLGWSPDGRTMYLVDSGPRVVHAFTFDPRARHHLGRTGPGHRGRGRRRAGRHDRGRRRRPLGGDLRRRAGPPLLPRRCAARGAHRPGPAEHLLRVRRPGPQPALRHDRHRELDRRATSRRTRQPASSTGWTPMPPAGRPHRSAPTPRGGPGSRGRGRSSRPLDRVAAVRRGAVKLVPRIVAVALPRGERMGVR